MAGHYPKNSYIIVLKDKMNNLDELLYLVKDRIDKEASISVLDTLGYNINRSGAFKLRGEEKTPSANVNPKNGNIKDFGNDESYDLIDILTKFHDMDFKSAVLYLCDYFGISYEVQQQRAAPTPVIRKTIQKKSPPQAIPHDQLDQEFNLMNPLTFANDNHKKELLSICPLWLYRTADKEDILFFHWMARYCDKNKTLVTRCLNELYNTVSYKYRRKVDKDGDIVKWSTRYNTSPNGSIMHRIHKSTDIVYIIEGHHDMLTAILLGISFIMLPTAGMKYKKEINDYLMGNQEIIFLVEDKAAYNCMSSIAAKIKDRDSIELRKINDTDEKKDLSDKIEEFKNKEEAIEWLS